MLKRWLANLPIQSKLVVIILLTLWSGLFASSAALISYDYQQSKQSLKQELMVLSQVIAERSQAALAFKDKRASTQNIASLKHRPSIMAACMYDAADRLFAQFEPGLLRCGDIATDSDVDLAIHDVASGLLLRMPLLKNQRQLGSLWVYSSLDEIQHKAWVFALWAFLIQCLAGIAAYFFTRRLQQIITQPILNLSALANRVASDNNYQLRAKKVTNDEVGLLVQNFNQMLQRIELADADRSAMIDELEISFGAQQAATAAAKGQTQAIREFFAGVSHDIKQPLNALGLFTSELRQAPNQLATLDKVDACLVNLNTLFNELLDIEKLESKLKQAKLKPSYLPAVINQLLDEFDVLAGDKGLSLRVYIHPVFAQQAVLSQVEMLSRLIRNLVSNAIRYTDQGGVLISCRYVQGQALLQVWDTGIGMNSEQQARIFQPFTQLKDDANSRQGFGLGLAIVQRISQALNHPLALKSRVGRGSVFSLHIPLAETKPLPKQKPAEKPVPALVGSAFVNLAKPILLLNLAQQDSINEHLTEVLKANLFDPYCADTWDDVADWCAEITFATLLVIVDQALVEQEQCEHINSAALAKQGLPFFVITEEQVKADAFMDLEHCRGCFAYPQQLAQLRPAILHQQSHVEA